MSCGTPGRSPTSAGFDADRRKRQALWLECCAACEVHRFDCPTDAIIRSAGPVLPRSK